MNASELLAKGPFRGGRGSSYTCVFTESRDLICDAANRERAVALAAILNGQKELVEALERIAKKSSCECWDVPAMGSGLPYVWKGCKIYHSKDPEEYCLCCIAHAALATLDRKDAGGVRLPKNPNPGKKSGWHHH